MKNAQTQPIATDTASTVEFEPMDRSAFLLKGVLAAGAVYGAGSITSIVSRAFAQGDGGDVDILNFAYTLELLEADFYEQAQKLDLGSDLAKFAREAGDNEQDHVDALSGAIKDLGGKPAATPEFTFPLKDESSFKQLAVTFEDAGVSAYNGAGPMLKSKDLLTTAGSIVQVEGRHAAAIRYLAGEDPVVAPFDPTLTEKETLKAVSPFIKS